MFHILDEVARQFRLFEWRDNLTFRRNLFRAACLRAVDAELCELKDLLSELRRLVHYNDMMRNDRAAYRQWETWLRKTVGGWNRLDLRTQRDFRNGKLQVSAVANRVAKFQRRLGTVS